MASYAFPQHRNASQSRSRYDYSDADEDYRTSMRPSRQAQYNAYNDSGRVFGDRPWMRTNDRPNAEPRYVAPYMNPAEPKNSKMSRYHHPQQQDEYYGYDSRSRSSSHYREPSRGRSHAAYSERASSSSRDRSESRSRLDRAESSAREMLGKTFDTRSKGVGAGIVGALMGAAIGRRLGDRDDNHALAGAIIGGLGVNALENQIHRSREKRREENEWEEDSHGGWRGSRGRSR